MGRNKTTDYSGSRVTISVVLTDEEFERLKFLRIVLDLSYGDILHDAIVEEIDRRRRSSDFTSRVEHLRSAMDNIDTDE